MEGPITVAGGEAGLSLEPLYVHESVEAPARKGRAKTISVRRLSKREMARTRTELEGFAYDRPQTRAECLHGEFAARPCPFVSCRFHLYLEVNPRSGSIRVNFEGLEPWELPETCALDVAERGGVTLEEVGTWLNLTRERVRQLEAGAIGRLRATSEAATLADIFE